MALHVELTRADGQLVCRCRVATSFASRFRGLMGVAQLPAGYRPAAARDESVHTHFMRFPIDVVFLDSEQRIVSVVKALPPWRLAAAKTAASALELAAGECDRLGLDEADASTGSPTDASRSQGRRKIVLDAYRSASVRLWIPSLR